ncbi:MAG TPA: hydantoinase/oxoprolinase family protein [Syntrophomonadaceae bacterium]|nr:hydantoinase/oxoprolinase family protein [Syntrophomonadaceae bacterium]
MYLIGIDVGGTFTDGTLIKSDTIVTSVKNPTDNTNIGSSLFKTLDQLLTNISDLNLIERVVMSTTAVTNLIATEKTEPTALVLLPGHGLPLSYYEIGDNCHFLQGAIDFRGNITEEISLSEIKDTIKDIKNQGIKRIAIAGKFSNRNNEHEVLVKELFATDYPKALVLISSEISNQLNFRRRAATTFFTALIYHEWQNFVEHVQKAVKSRGISAEVQVLKADGGTMPLEISRTLPCQTIYSGPAASTMGGVALTMDQENSVVIDIGGTTTDLSLVIEGEPLYASKGATINEHYTHVDAFSLTSLPIGGDSKIDFIDKGIEILNREDFALCFGGQHLTVTDVFNVSYDLKIGDYKKSIKALDDFASQHNSSSENLAQEVIDQVIGRLETAITNMFTKWEQEPAYKVWEVVNERKFKLHRIIGIGAASTAIVPVLAKRLGVEYFLNEHSQVANAIGTAVVRPTVNISLHVDTQNRFYTTHPSGQFGKIKNPAKFRLEDAKNLATEHLDSILKERNMANYEGEAVFYMEEQFNVIRGWDTTGKIFDIGIQVKPGFIPEFMGVK